MTYFCFVCTIISNGILQDLSLKKKDGFMAKRSTVTSISSKCASEFVGQHNKIGGITLGAILVYIWSISVCKI